MKKLSDDLKRMLSGLAYQDAGEFMPIREKMYVLGFASEIKEKSSAIPQQVVPRPVSKRIGLISDGRGLGAPLSYAIDACLRQDARIDLLVHGSIDRASIPALENQVQQMGIECQRIQLGKNAVDSISEYISSHPSLIFLVSMPDDSAARTLMEESFHTRGRRIPVPLVLIEDRPEVPLSKKSAA